MHPKVASTFVHITVVVGMVNVGSYVFTECIVVDDEIVHVVTIRLIVVSY